MTIIRPHLLLNVEQIQNHQKSNLVETCLEFDFPQIALYLSKPEKIPIINDYLKLCDPLKINHFIYDILFYDKKTIAHQKDIHALTSLMELSCQYSPHLSFKIEHAPTDKTKTNSIRHQMDTIIYCLERCQAPILSLDLCFYQFSPHENAEVIKDASKTHPIGLFFDPLAWAQKNYEIFCLESLWVFITQSVFLQNLGQTVDISMNRFAPVTPFCGILDALKSNTKNPHFLVYLEQLNHQNLLLASDWWNKNYKK